jgi:hypothetical protein
MTAKQNTNNRYLKHDTDKKKVRSTSEQVYQRRRDNTMDKRYQRANHNLYIKEEETTQ